MITRRAMAGSAAVPAMVLLFALSVSLHAQGILTVTPGRTVRTTAGTGVIGYAGDTGPASAATLASPSAVAYDANGNLFLADANNHVVREISTLGIITTIAGTGIEGYSGDNAAATAAQLDTPTGVAVDTSGNIYIADSHNHRIRKISGGTITTFSGTGAPGFSGDTGSAVAAQLWLPSGVAVDGSGNVYIADTNNHRIRKVNSGTINTIAGDGEELYAGDGAAATAAALDSPTGVAVDASGIVYIADRLNQRIRMVSGGIITTLAGTGTTGFSGGFSGDGAAPAAAMLSRPSSVSVDAVGNIYIADTGNQRIRQVGGGAITTIVGSGAQGYGGDAGLSTGAILNSPHSVASDGLGNLSIADRLNHLVRSSTLPALTFQSGAVGVASATQGVTLANIGSASVTVSTITSGKGFLAAAGGSCTALPITLAAGASCTESIEFLPVATGPANSSIVFSGPGVVPQSILLTGSATQAPTTVTLIANANPALAGQPISYTAVVATNGLGTPTGTIAFDTSGVAFDTQTLAPASATALFTDSSLATGTAGITVVYSGDSNFTSSTSTALPQVIEDFGIAATPNVSASSTSQTVVSGKAATFNFALTPLLGQFDFPVALTVAGLPPGASVVFSAPTATPGASPASFTMTVQTAAAQGLLHNRRLLGGESVAFSLLLLPFTYSLRRRLGQMKMLRRVALATTLLTCLGGLGSIAGCGSGRRDVAKLQQNYTLIVTGTATSSSRYTLQHSTSVTLSVQ